MVLFWIERLTEAWSKYFNSRLTRQLTQTPKIYKESKKEYPKSKKLHIFTELCTIGIYLPVESSRENEKMEKRSTEQLLQFWVN